MLSGHADPTATQAYARAFPQVDHRLLGSTGLHVSPVGFGGYRVDAESSAYHEALTYALRQGVNLIDTSTNYALGGSEELVGVVLRRLHNEGEVPREAVVVVSKAGYLQGRNYQIGRQRKAAGHPLPEVVEYADGLDHCIHPTFLQEQLTGSLRRLQMETLDVFLLHNPEYYLNWAHKQDVPRAEARAEYDRRIAQAFAYLESEVARGSIRYYGISSNTFPTPADEPGHTSLARVWEIATALGADHHFRVIQFPANLAERTAMTASNQPGGETLLSFAHARQLAVLINRPLNAVYRNQLLRLADVSVQGVADREQAGLAVERLVSVESRFATDVLGELELEPEEGERLQQLFGAGRILRWRWDQFGTYRNWDDVQTRYIVPRVQHGVHFLTGNLALTPGVEEWLQSYVTTLNVAMRAVDNVYAATAARRVSAIKRQVAAADPEWAVEETLSQMAIRALRSTRGITSVLVGMRRKEYVEDVLAEMRRAVDVEPREASWARLSLEIQS